MRWLANSFAGGVAASAVIAGTASLAAPPSIPAPVHYLFYLHGAIIENQGPYGVSERFGRYDYPGILVTFRDRGFKVVSEIRPRGTDVRSYADKVVGQVQALLKTGVAPSAITIVGASKGSMITLLVSTKLKNPAVRYVLLAGCNDAVIRTYDPHLTGEVLSIHEQSDELAGSCERVRKRSPQIARFEELRLNTGLGHGMVYRPIPEWVDPAVRWARR